MCDPHDFFPPSTHAAADQKSMRLQTEGCNERPTGDERGRGQNGMLAVLMIRSVCGSLRWILHDILWLLPLNAAQNPRVGRTSAPELQLTLHSRPQSWIKNLQQVLRFYCVETAHTRSWYVLQTLEGCIHAAYSSSCDCKWKAVSRSLRRISSDNSGADGVD